MRSPAIFRRNRAFTLIELLVVISIISLLASILLAALQTVQQRAKIAAGETFSKYNATSFGNNMILDFNFDSLQSATLPVDISGVFPNSSIGDIGTGCTIASTSYASFAGNSLVCVPNSSVIASPTPASVPQHNTFTFSAWIKLAAFQGSHGNPTAIFSNGNDFLMGVSNNIIELLLQNSQPRIVIDSPTALDTSNWHQVTVVYNGPASLAQIYVDGQLSLSQSATYTISLGQIAVGGLDYAGSGFSGNIDDVQVYSTALTAAEVEGYYAMTSPKYDFANAVMTKDQS